MFREESIWIREALTGLELPRGECVLDVGSSTGEYRRARQPHIEANVLAPLREHGVEIASLDIRLDPDVDYCADITAPDFDAQRTIGRRFGLVLCNNVLVHVADPARGARALQDLVAPGGYLLVSTPQAYRRVTDPEDNGIRPSPARLAELLEAQGGLELLRTASVRIDDRDYYRRSPLRGSWFSLAGLWVPVPAAVEQFRYAFKRLRWRVSCVLLRKAEEQ